MNLDFPHAYPDLGAVRQLQEVGFDPLYGWRPIEAPLTGFRLKTNLKYIRHVGYSTPDEPSTSVVQAYGYRGVIRLNGDALTYLYR